MTDAELWTLLQQAWSNNEVRGITGLPLYACGHFLQVLEGPRAGGSPSLRYHQDDPRHTNIETLLATPTIERTFPDWKMGLEHPRAATDLESVSPDLPYRRPSDSSISASPTISPLEPSVPTPPGNTPASAPVPPFGRPPVPSRAFPLPG
ncbi:MAG: hypothetical protein BRD31_00325 [Bacteroidetes bacterium QH_2_64_26]|nr:MAG: hypothetical protein BRD31_00325 [Bacteroidetes bacterium QH_2_64_26]